MVALKAAFCITLVVQIPLVDPEASCSCGNGCLGALAAVLCRFLKDDPHLGTVPSGARSGGDVGEGVGAPSFRLGPSVDGPGFFQAFGGAEDVCVGRKAVP